MNILHISDVHFSSGKVVTQQDIENFINVLIKWQTEKNKKINYVFVSGDIGNRGKLDDYSKAVAFFDKLIEVLNLSKDCIYFVAGNHDVDRSLITDKEREYKARLMGSTDELEIDRLKYDLYNNPNDLYAKFQSYNNFVKKYSAIRTISMKNAETSVEKDKYRFYYINKIDDIFVLGLNTALLSSEKDKSGHFYLIQEQLADIEREIGTNQKIFCIMHHPLDFLYQKEQEFLQDYFCKQEQSIIFCGHYHKEKRIQYDIEEKAVTQLRCGTLSANDTTHCSFFIYSFDFPQNRYFITSFVRDKNDDGDEWKYSNDISKYITRKTDEQIMQMENSLLELKNSKLFSGDERLLFDFIFGNISTQFDSLNDLNSYLENLFLNDSSEFIKIAERTFEIFNETPLLNVLKNYVIKIIVQYSDANNNIEKSNLFEKKEVLEMLMNILNVFVFNYPEFQLSQISYWVDFINRNISQIPENVLGVVTNVLRISIKKVNSKESQG